MAINKSMATIIVAFITGLSPMGVILTQEWMEQRKWRQVSLIHLFS